MIIKDLCRTITPPKKIERHEYLLRGAYPIIDQSQSYIAGYTNDLHNTLPDGEYILFGDHTCTLKYFSGRFAQGADGLKILSCKDDLDARYMYYAMKSLNFRSKRYKRHWQDFSQLSISTPSKEQQIRISSALALLDDKIELNNKINKKLNELSRLIYDYWFVQFDFPDENGRPYRSSGGKMIYNAQLKRNIPDGWHSARLSDIAAWISGAQPPKSQHIDHPQVGYVRFIQNRDYASNSNKRYIPISKNNKLCDRYDIMMDKYGDAGATRFGLSGAYNVALAKIDVKDNHLREYLRSFLSSNTVYEHLHQSCMASTRASLNGELLGSLSIPIPPSDIVSKYEQIAHEIISLILINKEESEQLARLRDWLLPMLMNGQVVINESNTKDA